MKAILFFLAALLPVCLAAAGQSEAKTQGPDTLYRAKCTACHRVYPPQEHTYQILEEHVARYGKGLDDEERRRILEYLKENAKSDPAKGGVMGDNQDD